MDAPVILTVRGTLNVKTLDEAKKVHNATAGSAEGMEAARSLSDISHTVFQPVVHKLSGAKEGELLFIDFWMDPEGLQKFFSNPHVQQQAGALFTSKDASVYMPARGAFTYRVPPKSGKAPRYVALLRAPVKSPDTTIAAFAKTQSSAVQQGRRRGQLSHDLYVALNGAEVLGVDTWSDLDGLIEHYSDTSKMKDIIDTLSGAPNASIWEASTGFNEW
jgi:hypothetical protein